VERSAGHLEPAKARSIVAAAGVYAFLVGGLTLLGYALDVRRLTDWDDDGISMFPNAAVCAFLCGLALLLVAVGGMSWRIAVRMAAGVVGSIGGLTLLQHLSGVNLGIDTLLFERPWGQRAAMAPMRMGPPASTSYLIIGMGLLLATCGPHARRLASGLAVVTVAISSLSLLGYWFGADQLFGMAQFTGIALQTSSALAVIGVGLIAALPEHGLAALLSRDDPGGVIVRRLILPIIVIPLVIGWLRVQAQEAGWFDTAFGTAMLSLLMIALFLTLLCWTAEGVSRQARLTRTAEEEVRERSQVSRTGRGLGVWCPDHRRTREDRVGQSRRRAPLRLFRPRDDRAEHRHAHARAIQDRARFVSRELPPHRRAQDHRHRPRSRRPAQGRLDVPDGPGGVRVPAGRQATFPGDRPRHFVAQAGRASAA
jgi:hypothetical protein